MRGGCLASWPANCFDEVEGWLEAVERHYGTPASRALETKKCLLASGQPCWELLVIRLQLPLAVKTPQMVMPSANNSTSSSPDSLPFSTRWKTSSR